MTNDAFRDPTPWIETRLRVLGYQLQAEVLTVEEFAQEIGDAILTWASAVHAEVAALRATVEALKAQVATQHQAHLADFALLSATRDAQDQAQGQRLASLEATVDALQTAYACLHARLQPLEADNARLRAALAAQGGIDL
jgi:ubiquinone biosynthesis protein UbiJ